ncbi:MAG: LysR family transcriptional regulator [Neptuniibacter sp.]
MRRWDAIEAFVAVVQKGSFTSAAESLGVSPSHVSRRVAELESQLGTPLIYRTTRSIRLSDAGEEYYAECNRLLQGFLSAEQKISQQSEEPSGLLKITCGATFGERFIAPLLPAFLKRYPKLKVDLHLSNSRVDLIRDGYDLAIRLGTMEDSSLLARRLCDRTEYICASPEYLELYGSPHTLNELSRHNCLQGSTPTWLFMDNGQRREFRVDGNWRSNSGPALIEAVTAGLGIAQLPDYYVAPLLKSGELVSLLDNYRYPLSGVWLVYPKVRQQLPRLKLLCDYLIESFSEHA